MDIFISRSRLLISIVFLGALGSALAHASSNQPTRTILPLPAQPFSGALEPAEKDSTQLFPAPVRAPEGAPNILLVMTDDVGFGTVSTFGGSTPTPNLDRLAERGLRYSQFHTTGVCSPTRAALLTGRNHHAVGLGSLTDLASPYPGYTARIAPSAATVARILRDNGYNTAMFGKDHNVPPAERSPSGPFDQWPTSRGFEYFYGFIVGDTNQWRPALYEGISPINGSTRPEGYLLDKDLADRTINWIHNQKASAPNKPFFIYFSTGSGHAPHHAPADWIAKFRGKFDHGWDKEREQILARQKAMGVVPPDTEPAARPEVIPAWNSLSAQQQAVYARFMEVYAASVAFQDAQIGRIVSELERMGIADSTLVVFVEGDNGSSGEAGLEGTINEMADLSSPEKQGIDIEWLAQNLDLLGGPESYQGYPIGWTYATSTPFPWFKQLASHLGAVRNGLVVSWPERIQQQGQVRSQYHHVIDIVPTLLEAAKIPAPKTVDGIAQQPLDGVSMSYSFDAPNAPSKRRTQYYEIHGNRGIYHEGWLANTTPRNMPWHVAQEREGGDITSYPWELYDLRSDFSQSKNLAELQPEKLQAMQKIFDREARKNNVYPIQDSGGMARAMRMLMASGEAFRTEYVYWGKDISIQMLSAPAIYRMPFTIEAEVVIPEGGGSGVIVAAGSYFGGWSFYLHEGRPTALAAISPLPLPDMQSRVVAPSALSPGPHTLRFDFETREKGGRLTISVDGEEVVTGDIARRPHVLAGNGETFDIGHDNNDPVSKDYEDGGKFNGEIKRVDVKIKLPLVARAMLWVKQFTD